MKLCGLRHVILSTLDQPVVPQNGIVRIRITAVRTATQYYARILKSVLSYEIIFVMRHSERTQLMEIKLKLAIFTLNEPQTTFLNVFALNQYLKEITK